MYEELSAPLQDKGTYLQRMRYNGPPEVSAAALSALVFAHQKAVPFENYDICELNQPISLEIPHLYEKVAVQRRGGYCFELNASFAALLAALGFTVTPHLAMIHRGNEQPSPPLHRINLVAIGDKQYFTDVGFGGAMPAGAVRLEEGPPQDVQGSKYHFEKRQNERWVLFRETSEKTIEPMISFSAYPSDPVDFIAPNYYTSTHPSSLFVRNRMANIRFDDGFASIGNGVFHLVRGGSDTTTEISTKAQEYALLEEYFGIKLG